MLGVDPSASSNADEDDDYTLPEELAQGAEDEQMAYAMGLSRNAYEKELTQEEHSTGGSSSSAAGAIRQVNSTQQPAAETDADRHLGETPSTPHSTSTASD